jgi:hypothetical protein
VGHSQISHLEQQRGDTKGRLITAIDREYSKFSNEEKRRFISIVIEEILERKPELKEKLEEYLSRLRLNLVNGKVIPVELLDYTELLELPMDAHVDLVKAMQRFRDGDLSGAISSACAAIDTVTSKIYKEKSLGNPNKSSFQKKCKKSIIEVGTFRKIEQNLKEIGWETKDIDIFIKNFEGALNHASYVLQSLRSKMGDVHGTKPALKELVFTCLKWATLILRVLNEK